MIPKQLSELRKAAEKSTKGEWEIDWYECLADRDDVKARTAKKVGDVLWRVPKQIGPISVGENHWAKLHLDVSEEDARHIAAANPATILQLLDYVESLEKQRDDLLAALENTRHWFEAERKSISKGNGSQWSMWQCDEQMELIDTAIASVKESK